VNGRGRVQSKRGTRAGLLYIPAQLAGATLGALMLKMSIDYIDEIGPSDLAVCGPGKLSPTGLFISEAFWLYCLLLIAYGIAFDPKQGEMFGQTAPICVAAAVALFSFASSNLSGGYGAGLNWAQCVGIAVAHGEFNGYEWIYVVAMTTAVLLHSLLFVLVPPHHAEDGTFQAPLLLVARAAAGGPKRDKELV